MQQNSTKIQNSSASVWFARAEIFIKVYDNIRSNMERSFERKSSNIPRERDYYHCV
jgi:hypothetical protein